MDFCKNRSLADGLSLGAVQLGYLDLVVLLEDLGQLVPRGRQFLQDF
jgi:hypothetical protein